MKIILYQSFIIIFILMMMIIALNFLSKKTFQDREKNSPFECGFDPKNSARLPFSLQFFLIAVIFVIFDVELTLLLPIIIIMKISNIMNMTITINFFILLLLFGLYHEQNQGSLNWVK
uniref:NADH-ubiquinone oxidoreductase chain 3 n=1 Tax=Hylobitelus xiaoi TaxID=1247388 RepID=A0A059PA38_HYLXI|nr:NADH dehydrogenase subunit 3 [Hylobitelus xiaoi]AFV63179.1 NADH dehydrogenase subunit 3 [Hylobitelus xiaoi]WCZ71285.1 NADH dehydrogenase subunit 3 [Hylobitelus xiaoi]